jgi:hypothetical protein
VSGCRTAVGPVDGRAGRLVLCLVAGGSAPGPRRRAVAAGRRPLGACAEVLRVQILPGLAPAARLLAGAQAAMPTAVSSQLRAGVGEVWWRRRLASCIWRWSLPRLGAEGSVWLGMQLAGATLLLGRSNSSVVVVVAVRTRDGLGRLAWAFGAVVGWHELRDGLGRGRQPPPFFWVGVVAAWWWWRLPADAGWR